jgi:hypothetical protein
MNCRKAFSLASTVPKSYSVDQVARECLDRHQLHALRGLRDGLLLGPASGFDAAAEIVDVGVRDFGLERPDLGGDVAYLDACHHSPWSDVDPGQDSIRNSCYEGVNGTGAP